MPPPDRGGCEQTASPVLPRRIFTSKWSKNTLLRKALENHGEKYGGLMGLEGPTSVMFCEVAVEPAKVISKFRKEADKVNQN